AAIHLAARGRRGGDVEEVDRIVIDRDTPLEETPKLMQPASTSFPRGVITGPFFAGEFVAGRVSRLFLSHVGPPGHAVYDKYGDYKAADKLAGGAGVAHR